MLKLGPIITFCLAVLVMPTHSFALGLGEIEVTSFLNQPLSAEVEVISARAGEIDDLLVTLASRDAFNRAGLSRPSILSELRFNVQKSEDGLSALILITTNIAVKEPFLNFLVEADWSRGRLLKEFTVLLDPPFFADSRPTTKPAAVIPPQPLVETPSLDSGVATEPAVATPLSKPVAIIEPDVPVQQPIAITEPDVSVQQPIAITEPVAMVEPLSAEDAAATDIDAETSDTSQVIPLSDNLIDQELLIIDEGDGLIQPEIQIAKGDTLWRIASQFKDADHNMSQVMLAMQRLNPEAFGDNNINNLQIGAVLRAPSAADMDQLSQQQAFAEVLEQNGLWDDYVASISGKVAEAIASEGGSAGQDQQAAETRGDLSLLTPGDGSSDAAGLTSEGQDANALATKLALAQEELDAARVMNRDMESKIADLEARLSKFDELQKMVEIEDNSLAQMQAQQAAKMEAEQAELSEKLAVEKAARLEAENQAAKLQAEQAATLDAEQAAAASALDQKSAAEEALLADLLAEEAAAAAEQDKLAAVTPEVMTQPDPAQSAVVESPPAPVIVTEPAPKPGSFLDGLIPAGITGMLPSLDSLSFDPLMLGALVGIALLLLLLVLFKRRKKGQSDDEPDNNGGSDEPVQQSLEPEFEDLTPVHMVGGSDATSNTLTAVSSPGEQEDEFSRTAIISQAEMPTPEAPAGGAGDQDDVLNEVDVYLAYGLYDNAEELLKENLQSSPDRADYRSKLLDTYFATKNVDAFLEQANLLKSQGAGAEAHWPRVQVMGYELAPDNTLFSGAKDSGLSAADLEIAKPAAADFDLGGDEDDTNFSITDFNLGDSSESDSDFIDTQEFADKADEGGDEAFDLPSLSDDDVTNVRVDSPAAETELALPDDIGELEFSFDSDSDEPSASMVDDDAAMDFELPDDLDISSVDEALESTEMVDLSEEMDELAEMSVDLDDSGASTDDDDDISIVELDNELDLEATAFLDSVDITSEVTAMLELGMDDTAIGKVEVDDVDDEVKLELDDESLVLEQDDDEDISMDVDMEVEHDGSKTDTFAPGDFDDPDELFASESDIEDIDFDDIDGLMLPDDVDEVSTKLDLARAFIDMGDAEGARSSLGEVIIEGNAEQKSEATQLLKQL